MPLSEKHLQHRCLVHGGHRTCRYLEQTGYKKGECQKLLAARKRDIDKEVNKHLAAMKKAGHDPSQHWSPCGDGGTCSGFMYLPTIVQGYDQKKK